MLGLNGRESELETARQVVPSPGARLRQRFKAHETGSIPGPVANKIFMLLPVNFMREGVSELLHSRRDLKGAVLSRLGGTASPGRKHLVIGKQRSYDD